MTKAQKEFNSKFNSAGYKAKYSTKEYLHQTHIKFYPSPISAVYGLILDGNIVYIGSSHCASYRISYHLKYMNSRFSKQVDTTKMSYIILEDATGTNTTELKIMEQHYMDLFNPKYNQVRAISEAKVRAYYETQVGSAEEIQDEPDTKS